MMKFKKLVLNLIALGAIAQAEAQLDSFSLAEALDYGVQHNIDFQSKKIDALIQEQENREILAQALPQITGSSNFLYNYKVPTSLLPGEIVGMPGALVPVQFQQKYGFSGTLQLQQVLFEPNVFVGLKARDASMELAEENVNKTVLDAKENIYKSYYAVLVGRVSVDLVDVNIKMIDSMRNTTEAIYEAGFAERLDVDKLDVQLNNLANEKIKAENFVKIAEYNLKFNMGYPVDKEIVLKDSLSQKQVEDFADILDVPIKAENTIDFKILEINQKLADLNIERFKYQRLPTLAMVANYGFNAPTNTFNYFSSDANYFGQGLIGLSLSVPLLTSGANKAKIGKAKYQSQQINLAFEQLNRAYSMQNKTLKTNLKNALISLKNQEANIKLARNIYEKSRIKYETGVGSSLEVIQSSTEYQQAQSNYYQALYDAILARINIQKALNKL